jgi:O-antigen ligase
MTELTPSSAAPEGRKAGLERVSLRGDLSGWIFLALCAVVALAPLPLGSARPLAWDIMALFVGLLLILSLFLPSNGNGLTKELALPFILFGIVIVFILLQTSPWVPAALQNPLWEQASESLNRAIDGSIAVERNAAFQDLLRLICYSGIFYLAWLTGRDGARARIAIWLVAVSGNVYATYGLVDYWSGNKTVLWFPKLAYLTDLTGTFVNRNSFATYLGICTLAALCLLLQLFSRVELRGDWRRKLAATIEFSSTHIGKLIMFFILVTALVLTHSRGGLLATLLGTATLMCMIALAPSMGHLRRIGIWGVVPFVVFLIALLASGAVTFDRMMSADLDAIQRITVYRLVIQAIGNYPLFGIGLGSFAELFPIYRTSAIPVYFDLAHNDYLQNILELGIPAAIFFFAALGRLVVICLRGVRIRQRDAIYPCLAVAATVLVGLHALVDFSLQIPAVTVAYMFLLGIGVAQSHSSRASGSKKSATL